MSHDFWSPVLLGIVFVAVGGWVQSLGTKSAEQKQLARLEEKVNRLLDALNVPHEVEPTNDVRDFLRRGMRINAVKVYREQTGTSLKVSKDAVEAMEAEMKAKGLI